MDKLVLYSSGCPKCKVVELKLKQKNIEFELIEDENKVVEIGKANNILSVPILQVNDKYLDFSSAINYIKERN